MHAIAIACQNQNYMGNKKVSSTTGKSKKLSKDVLYIFSRINYTTRWHPVKIRNKTSGTNTEEGAYIECDICIDV